MKAGMARFVAAGARSVPAACGACAPRPPDYGLGSLGDRRSGAGSRPGLREAPAPVAAGVRCSKIAAGGEAFQCPHSPRRAAADAPGARGAPAPGTPQSGGRARAWRRPAATWPTVPQGRQRRPARGPASPVPARLARPPSVCARPPAPKLRGQRPARAAAAAGAPISGRRGLVAGVAAGATRLQVGRGAGS